MTAGQPKRKSASKIHRQADLNVLVYKRTHKGDPDKDGIFGIHKCMGRVRGWNYDAVIGVGGKKPWSGHEDIALKINWIGINAKKNKAKGNGLRVTFEHFCLFEGKGPHLRELAPKLFHYMYEEKDVRVVMSKSLHEDIRNEIRGILDLAKECPESEGIRNVKSVRRKCR